MKRLVVVGGGISGLAAAWSARRASEEAGVAAELEILLLEGEREVGGKALSVERDGWLVEAGPTGFLDNEPVLDRLVEASGLTKLAARAEAARRFVVRGGVPREIRPHPVLFATSGILSPLGLVRLAGEIVVPARRDGAEESVWDFAARRLGSQVADRLVAPMVLGVFAGDAKRTSLAAAFPRMAELEREHGGLLRAMLALKRGRKTSSGPAGPAGTLTSFAGGLQSFPRALADRAGITTRAGFTTRTGARVRGLTWAGDTWRVGVQGEPESIRADSVVLAIEPWAAGSLVADLGAPDLARALDTIACPPVAVVGMGYGAEALARCPRGFGALIPRNEGYRILGVLWDSHLFPGRSAEGTLLMRAMLGGATDPGVGSLSADELARIARDDLARLLGLSEPPVFEEVRSWPRAIPQYELGHLDRVQEIERALATLRPERPGLHLAGNYLHGVAFGKAAAHGWRCGRQAFEELGLGAPVART